MSWEKGFAAGWTAAQEAIVEHGRAMPSRAERILSKGPAGTSRKKPKQKPSAYNNFVSKKSELPRFKYKTSRGKKKKGMINLKAIGIAWRKLSPAAQKKWK